VRRKDKLYTFLFKAGTLKARYRNKSPMIQEVREKVLDANIST